MNTEQFFNIVLADDGLRCILALGLPAADGRRERRQALGTSNAWAASTALAGDTAPWDVFFGIANFLTRQGGRKAENAQAARSFIADLDVGENKPYATASDAMRALHSFETDLGLPPSLVVKSGVGLHAYWPMDADLTPSAWKLTATLLKAAMQQHGLHADPSRTADIASVLRPIETTHRKGLPKLVRVLRAAGQTDHDNFRGYLVAYTGISPAEELDQLPARPAHVASALNSDLTSGLGTYPPAFADRIADECAVMGLIRDTRGKVDQPTWYRGLQLLNRCEDGRDVAHEWSKGDSRYNPAEVDATLARVSNHGPTLCSTFQTVQPDLCAACPHNGVIKSPIHLGVAPPQAIVVTTSTPTPPGVASLFGVAVPEDTVIDFPFSYSWRRSVANSPVDQLCAEGTDEDGPVFKPICNTLFYPVARLGAASGASMEIEVLKPMEGKQRFIIETSTIAKGGDGLMAALGRHEIMALPGMTPHMQNYLSRFVDILASKREQTASHTHFGWHDQKFVVGQTLVRQGGAGVAALQGLALTKAAALASAGTLDEWKRVIDTAYNQPGQEAFQFMVLLGFAAPLFSRLQQVDGVTVYAHSDGTGVGKTTAQRAALSIWGNWRQLQLAEGKATVNALWALMGVYHNLPVLFDELTNMTNKDASEIVFSVSSGTSKERLKGDGELQDNNANWSTILMSSGNALLSDKITQHRGNAEAELARLFEFTVDTISPLSPNEANALFPKLLDNYGHAGLVFMQHVVDNMADVQDLLTTVHTAINTEAEVTQGERYWSALFASVLTAQIIARQLNLVEFPIKPVKAWMLNELSRNRGMRTTSISDPLELFGQMMQDMTPGIIVTVGEGDLRTMSSAAKVEYKPTGPIVGRSIVTMGGGDTPQELALSVTAIKQWCNKHSVSSRSMFDALVAAGHADPVPKKYVLGKGTIEYAGSTTQVRCWIVHPSRMGGRRVRP